MVQHNTSTGAGLEAVAISAETLTEAEKQALLAVDAHNTPSETPAEAPAEEGGELIAGKFKTQEDFVKAYEESQRKITELSQGKPPAPAEEAPAAEGDLAIKEAAEAATGDPQAFDKYAAEYAENQTLTDESYKELEGKGISREMVDYYIRGQEAAAADFQGAVYSAAGGKETYGEVLGWAGENLTAAEQAAYNTAVNSGDAAQASLAASGLKARFDAANGTAPRLLGGDAAGGAASDVFQNYSQVTAAMQSTEYKNDPHYRSQVDAKIMRSPL